VLPCFFPRLHAVSPDHSDGAERPDHSSVWLFPAFYMLWHFCSAFVSQECAGKSKRRNRLLLWKPFLLRKIFCSIGNYPGHNRMHSGKLCKSCSHGRGAEIIRLNSICHTVKKSGRFVPAKAWISNGLAINTIADGLISVFNITSDHDSFYKSFDFRQEASAVQDFLDDTRLLIPLFSGIGMVCVYNDSRIFQLEFLVHISNFCEVFIMIVWNVISMTVDRTS